MKFVIRDKKEEKQEENIIEFWLEKVGSNVCLRAESNKDGCFQTILVINSSGDVCLTDFFSVTGLRKGYERLKEKFENE